MWAHCGCAEQSLPSQSHPTLPRRVVIFPIREFDLEGFKIYVFYHAYVEACHASEEVGVCNVLSVYTIKKMFAVISSQV
jgi:hypothetical protein